MTAITIKDSEHVFIAGMTGSGKSYLAERYLASYDYVVKLDTKDEVTERRLAKKDLWVGLDEGKDYTVCTKLTELGNIKTKKIIYVPDFEEQSLESYNTFLKWCYERGNTIVWIDELMSICPNATKYPLYLKAIATRGRSKNVAMWSLTQRPVDIPSIVTANSTHFFVFDLMLPQDRTKMSQVTAMPNMTVKPGKYNFWYFKNGNDYDVKARLKQ